MALHGIQKTPAISKKNTIHLGRRRKLSKQVYEPLNSSLGLLSNKGTGHEVKTQVAVRDQDDFSKLAVSGSEQQKQNWDPTLSSQVYLILSLVSVFSGFVFLMCQKDSPLLDSYFRVMWWHIHIEKC